MNRFPQKRKTTRRHYSFAKARISLTLFVLTVFLLGLEERIALSDESKDSDDKLIEQMINSNNKGAGVIMFDNKNIKQFWTSNSVVSQDNQIKISLIESNDNLESIPYKIQLANVNESLDCDIKIYSLAESLKFDILNSKSKKMSSSTQENDFLNYHVFSAKLHMEDLSDFSFYIKFYSSKQSVISIKKLALYFANNPESRYLASPGNLNINAKEIIDFGTKNELGENSFSVTGKWRAIISKKSLFITDNTITSSVTIKNIGDAEANVYLGYIPYSKDHKNIEYRNTPYKSINKVLNVVSCEPEKNKLIVDAYSEWEKGCFLALNAKEDLSDFPNFDIIDAPISKINQLDDSHSEILLDSQIKKDIMPGTKVRILSKRGSTYVFTNSKTLKPNEEISLTSTISKDDALYQFSSKSFCKGTYYVIPLILLSSVNSQEESTILIQDYHISY